MQFSPHSRTGYQITSVLENGNVQIWDSGRLTSPLQQFTAHNGPVFSVDWHPTESKWLATGGRDKTIKIWDLENRNSLQYCIQTIASVGRVRWRPSKKFQVASSSLVVDFSVSVWDIRRPYIPYATFTEHKDITKGFVWIDAGTLLSAGKDNTLYHHYFDEAVKPMQSANPVALDISNPGDIALAYREDIVAKSASHSSHQSHQSARQHQQQSHQSARSIVSTPASGSASSSLPSAPSPLISPLPALSNHSLLVHNGSQSSAGTGSNIIQSILTNKSKITHMFGHKRQPVNATLPRECTSSVVYISNIATLSMEWFVDFARSYQLTGRSFDELCQNNADVAYRLGKIAVCNAWKIVRERYAVSRSAAPPHHRMDASHEQTDPVACENSRILNHLVASNVIGPLRHVNGNHFAAPPADSCDQNVSPPSGVGSDFFDQSDSDDSYVNIHPMEDLRQAAEHRDAEKAANFFFGDGDWSTCAASLTDASFLTREVVSTSPHEELNEELPEEAFIQRHEIPDFPNPPLLSSASPPKSDRSPADDQLIDGSAELEYVVDLLLTPALSVTRLRPLIQKDDHLIENMLRAFASEGDVQSCVSLLIVLGDRMKNVDVDELTQEKWFTAYVELLYRFQLWSVATQVISLSQIPNVNSLNQTSTNVNLCCGNCGKLNHGTGPFVCKNCNTQTCICCVCNEIVYGLYAWCEGCSHGGHLLHLKEWYDANSRCPTGCGHECEYAAAR